MIHFYGQDTTKPTSRYRLVHSSKFKQLVDEHYVDDEDINEYGDYLNLAVQLHVDDINIFLIHTRFARSEQTIDCYRRIVASGSSTGCRARESLK